MIVDDDPLIREGLAVAFSNDFEIHQAETRVAAIALLRKLPSSPQLALIDLQQCPGGTHLAGSYHAQHIN